MLTEKRSYEKTNTNRRKEDLYSDHTAKKYRSVHIISGKNLDLKIDQLYIF